MRTRAERRASNARYKHIATKKVREDFSFSSQHFEDLPEHDREVRVGRQANTRTLCSCWMCRSPRKVFGNSKNGLTTQEMKNLERADSQDFCREESSF